MFAAEDINNKTDKPDGPDKVSKTDNHAFDFLKSPWAGKNPVPIRYIHLDISNRCNENCPICYYPDASDKLELTLLEIENIAKKYKGCAVVLGGREPTMRRDLDKIVSVISPYCSTLLLTNGFKLTQPNYLDKLQQAGLDGVILSFNGSNDDAYSALGGHACFTRKMAAFNSLKQANCPTIISMTVAKDINTSHVSSVLKLCQENTAFVREFRLRALRPLGRCTRLSPKTLEMHELVELVAAALNTPLEELLQGIYFWHEMGEAFKVDAYKPQACTLEFMTKRIEGKWFCEGALISKAARWAVNRWKQNKWYRHLTLPVIVKQLVRVYGWKPFVRRIWHLKGRLSTCTIPSYRARLAAVKGEKNLLQITLKSWPLPDDFTTSEKLKCATLFVSKNESCRFCERNIQYSQKRAG